MLSIVNSRTVTGSELVASPKRNDPSLQGSFNARRLRFSAANAAIALVSLVSASCTHQPTVVIHTKSGQAVRVPVELARTPAEQQRGLMFRRDLAADAGMLFMFSETEEHSFWMKNTPLPLDMIFIGDDLHVVGIVADTVPFSTSSRSVGQPSRYVLEVHGGFSKQHGIASGDRVELLNTANRT